MFAKTLFSLIAYVWVVRAILTTNVSLESLWASGLSLKYVVNMPSLRAHLDVVQKSTLQDGFDMI